MTETAQSPSVESPPELSNLSAPSPMVTPPTLTGPSFTPQQILYFYSPDQWENFIREWATGLATAYDQIKRLGGSNDHGVDVAAFKTAHGFEGTWDCFQGKHYADALKPSDAYPEMLKVFLAVINAHYQLPDAYYFLAPKGCGATLDRLLSKPSDLRQKFLAELQKDKGCAATLEANMRGKVRALAEKTDFSMFRSVQLSDALETHRGTPYYVARFGGPLPARPPVEPPPDEFAEGEARYVAQLVDVYNEQVLSEQITQASVSDHATYGEHFKRQRISFYSAEALYMHARDSVPKGTYEALQKDLHSGVVEVAEAEHANGMDRLREVLTAATRVQLDGHAALLSVSRMDDRKGICHQLANEDRLTWVKEKP